MRCSNDRGIKKEAAVDDKGKVNKEDKKEVEAEKKVEKVWEKTNKVSPVKEEASPVKTEMLDEQDA